MSYILFCSCIPSLETDPLNVCHVNGSECSGHVFHGDDVTVIAEWDLVCGRRWVKSTITSVQMAGVLLGAVLAGQLGDRFGRRKSLYSFVSLHILLNVIAAVSTSWVMFAVLRFFLGICMGAILVIVIPFSMEFLPIKYRPLLGIIPSWTLGVAIFSLAAFLLKDWSHLHIACAVCSVPSLLGGLFVPESIRWLATQGRLDEAMDVFKKISRVNKKPLPTQTADVLQNILQKEKHSLSESHQYSYLDVFRGFRMAKATVIIMFFYFSMSVSFYGISFGVGNLFGSVYLNMFLMGFIEVPVQVSTFFMNNRFGRKYTSMFFFFACSFSCAGCIVAHLCAGPEARGPAIRALSIIAKMMIGCAWSCISVWGSEFYPTVTRSLGVGFTSVGARIGGILAPFIIDLESSVTFSYSFMTAVFIVCTVLSAALEETFGKELANSLVTSQDHHFTPVPTVVNGDKDKGNPEQHV